MPPESADLLHSVRPREVVTAQPYLKYSESICDYFSLLHWSIMPGWYTHQQYFVLKYNLLIVNQNLLETQLHIFIKRYFSQHLGEIMKVKYSKMPSQSF